MPFTVAIPPEKVEKDFRERRLVPEQAGIFNWALSGLAAYREQGLHPPEAVRASTKEYRQDMDVVGQWIDERCERDPKASVPTSHAYIDYSQWAADEVGWELKKLTFRRHFSDRCFPAEKGTHGQRMIRGLRLKSFRAAAMAANLGGPERMIEAKIVHNDGIKTDQIDDELNERIKALFKDDTEHSHGGRPLQ